MVKAILRHADIFFDLSDAQLDLVASICQEHTFSLGEVIFEENSASDELFVIAEGEVDIIVDPSLVSDHPDLPAHPTTIATLRRGQSFGEIALVDQGLRSATARSASSRTRLIVIPREPLMTLCESEPVLGYRLMRNLAADLATKIRSADLWIREQLLYGGKGRQGATRQEG